jgi:hypothetical protein
VDDGTEVRLGTDPLDENDFPAIPLEWLPVALVLALIAACVLAARKARHRA